MQLTGNINISFHWNVVDSNGESVSVLTNDQKEQLLEATHERIKDAFEEGWREGELNASIESDDETEDRLEASGWFYLVQDLETN